MTPREQGFLLLTQTLGDPGRKPLTVAQFRSLTRQAQEMERPLEDRELSMDDLIAIGELGLSGECRAVSGLDHRVKEAARLGFTRAVVPARNLEKRKIKADIQLLPIGSIFEILKLLAPKKE